MFSRPDPDNLDGRPSPPFTADAALIVDLRVESRATMWGTAPRMGGIGIKHGPEVARVAGRPRTRRKLWVGVAAVLGLALVFFLLLRSGALDGWMAPGFEVAEVHAPDGTMRLHRANHTYLVRCDTACSNFRVGHSYRMHIVSGALLFESGGRQTSLPILEEQVDFTGPGGHG